MKRRAISVALILAFGLTQPTLALDKSAPVRMGCGLMTFDTVPGWGLGPDGKSVIGPCHGSVVVDKEGNIYTSAHAGVFCFSPDGTLLATSAVRGSPLQLWSVRDGVELRSFAVEADAHGRDPAPIAFSPDGKRLAAADANRQIYVWELATETKIKTFAGHQKAVTSIAFLPMARRSSRVARMPRCCCGTSPARESPRCR